MGKKRGFIRKKVAEMVGIPARRVQFYTDEGLVTPEIANPIGRRGATRRYSQKNLIDLALIKALDAHGLLLSKIKWILPYIQDELKQFPWYTEGKPSEGDRIQVVIFGLMEDKLKVAFYRIPPNMKEIGIAIDQSTSALVLDISNIIARLPMA